MSSPSPAPKSANLENESVRQILRAALDQWTRHGFHGVSLREIAAAAGVSKSLVHYHFASKEHLLLELQVAWSRKIATEVRDQLAALPPSPAAALTAVEQIWDSMVLARAHFPFRIELWRQSVNNAEVLHRLREADRRLREVYSEGIAAALGPFADYLIIPVPRAAALLQVILEGIALRLFIEPDLAEVRTIFDDAKAIFIPAVLPVMRGSPAP